MLDIDKTTLHDLSVFHAEDSLSVFHILDHTQTSNGRDQLYRNLQQPFNRLADIEGVQGTLQSIGAQLNGWPSSISNGTVKVIEKLLETALDPLPETVSPFNAFTYKLVHGPDYSLAKYSAVHCFDFIRGLQLISGLFPQQDNPLPLQQSLESIRQALQHPEFEVARKYQKASDCSVPELLQLVRFVRFRFKQNMISLLQAHAQLDAWYGMASCIRIRGFQYPAFRESAEPFFEARGLYHLLLPEPVAYDVAMDPEKHFIFLTGANMAGKSTFIKAVGLAVFLAHCGMAVPAASMNLCVFHGILSNINVADNIIRGESYFFNEVQRIKSTIHKINDGRHWLILIDELFKGTNIQDAMKCSSLVIEGLLKMKNALFILSTHLYEIGEPLKASSGIRFYYFETHVDDDQLQFSYQLKEGISNDRFGYLILKREGVVDLLENL